MNIKLQLVESVKAADIVIWWNDILFDSHADKDTLLVWDDSILAKLPNVTRYYSKQLDYITEANNGTSYGFPENNDNDGTDEFMANNVITINKDSQELEESLKFINWICDPMNYLSSIYGPKGFLWDTDKKGEYYFTDDGKKHINDSKLEFPEELGGGTLMYGRSCLPITMWPLSYYGLDFRNP